jgi:hypothetical protein
MVRPPILLFSRDSRQHSAMRAGPGMIAQHGENARPTPL